MYKYTRELDLGFYKEDNLTQNQRVYLNKVAKENALYEPWQVNVNGYSMHNKPGIHHPYHPDHVNCMSCETRDYSLDVLEKGYYKAWDKVHDEFQVKLDQLSKAFYKLPYGNENASKKYVDDIKNLNLEKEKELHALTERYVAMKEFYQRKPKKSYQQSLLEAQLNASLQNQNYNNLAQQASQAGVNYGNAAGMANSLGGLALGGLAGYGYLGATGSGGLGAPPLTLYPGQIIPVPSTPYLPYEQLPTQSWGQPTPYDPQQWDKFLEWLKTQPTSTGNNKGLSAKKEPDSSKVTVTTVTITRKRKFKE